MFCDLKANRNNILRRNNVIEEVLNSNLSITFFTKAHLILKMTTNNILAD